MFRICCTLLPFTLKPNVFIIFPLTVTVNENGLVKVNSQYHFGIATIKVTKLTKKGTFKYTVKFAGDKAYKAITKKGKMTIK